MSSAFRSPVGPQPNKVYWRRRLFVLLGLLAVVVVVVLIVFRPPADPTPPAAEAPATTPSAAPVVDEGPQPCAPEQVLLTAVTDADSYAPDQLPLLSWRLENTGSEPCTLNAGTTQQVFTVTSGDETIWTSTDCQSDASDLQYTLQPGAQNAAASTPFSWSRERSAADTCDASVERDPVVAGGATYRLSVSVGGFSSADTAPFILE